MSSFPSPGSVSKLWEYDCAVGRCRPHNGCRKESTSHLMPPKGVWEGPHVILHFVNNDDVVPFPRALVPSLPCYLLCLFVNEVCLLVSVMRN
eukprot:scaffold10273_cov122-Isochrysis_galbana.AAC.1